MTTCTQRIRRKDHDRRETAPFEQLAILVMTMLLFSLLAASAPGVVAQPFQRLTVALGSF
ncbi:hypothetical protein NK718_20360 [Alsobacter sp. SYSU M60028]|uniref:Uncharacterized protein n=1 Tax=Alsobacter ponti TaxID=2962936 RepID=A0ABT1LHA1_9HYPH|nr:hypothetical protein [Alsobacter ponti]MCP8940887.1 hypothetical protein [Alsobacter ponti]